MTQHFRTRKDGRKYPVSNKGKVYKKDYSNRQPINPKYKIGDKVERGEYDSKSRKIVSSGKYYTIKNIGRDEHYNWYEFEETPGRFYQHTIYKKGELPRT